jgi:biotin carboxylase
MILDTFECRWILNNFNGDSAGFYFQTADLYIRRLNQRPVQRPVVSTSETYDLGKIPAFSAGDVGYQDQIWLKRATKALAFIVSTAERVLRIQGDHHECCIKVILAPHSGYLVRSDFLDIRLFGCDSVEICEVFSTVLEHIQVRDISSSECRTFSTVVHNVVGAIVVKQHIDEQPTTTMGILEKEVIERLSFSWMLPSRLVLNHLVLVGVRLPLAMKTILAVGDSLGIQITVLGPPDSWLCTEDPKLMAKYVPMDLTPDLNLQSRIEHQIHNLGQAVHGVTTFTDNCMVAVARVAEKLGLPTSPSTAIAIATNKYSTRMLRNDWDDGITVSGLAELENLLALGTPLSYPLVVKPCFGSGSKGVLKALDQAGLLVAVATVEKDHKGVDILIEKYVDGPEFDANFVLLNGEIAYFELVDGFLCTADVALPPGRQGDFSELDHMWPSQHPEVESEFIRSSIYRTLLQLGFRTGVFHVEGRVLNSQVHYATKDGILDLYPHEQVPLSNLDLFILEINARAPGHGATRATRLTFGVDYQALHMLAALGASSQMSSQAKSFQNGAQHWCNAVFINAGGQGILDSADIYEQLQTKRPDLLSHVMYSLSWHKPRSLITIVPDRVGLFLVRSKRNRREARLIAQEIRKTVKISLV